MAMEKAFPGWRNWALVLLTASASATVLYAMGRLPICACGTVKLWHGAVYSSENSQHLSDWYSPSHVLHGLVFYMVLHRLLPRWSVGSRLVVAAMLEAAWEIAENTDAVIGRYREATMALDYFGDSIINSMADITMMCLGFLIASRAPVWASVLLFVAAELFVGLVIRDGLVLNVVMLVWPLEAILMWQSGG
jgi:hypothetical protein